MNRKHLFVALALFVLAIAAFVASQPSAQAVPVAEGQWAWGFTGSRVPYGRGDTRGSLKTEAAFAYNDSTNTLTAGTLSGNVTGNVTGNLNGTVGGVTPAAATFTTISASDNLTFTVIGKGLKVKEGSNAKMGTAALSSGVALVSTTAVGATSRVFVTGQSTTGACYTTNRVNGTSFAIYSTDVSDSGDAAWVIIDPAP